MTIWRKLCSCGTAGPWQDTQTPGTGHVQECHSEVQGTLHSARFINFQTITYDAITQMFWIWIVLENATVSACWFVKAGEHFKDFEKKCNNI